MDAQQDKAYGEGFRQGVTRLLDEVSKLGVLAPEVQEKVTMTAAKLCLAEAMAEQKAAEFASRAKTEWHKHEPEVQASIHRVTEAAKTAAKEIEKRVNAELPGLAALLKSFFPGNKPQNPPPPVAPAPGSSSTH